MNSGIGPAFNLPVEIAMLKFLGGQIYITSSKRFASVGSKKPIPEAAADTDIPVITTDRFFNGKLCEALSLTKLSVSIFKMYISFCPWNSLEVQKV